MNTDEILNFLHRLYLKQIRIDIKLRTISSNGSSREEVETLKAEARRIEADIYPIARNFSQFADTARLGAYITFIKSAGEMKEAEMAERDYRYELQKAQARRYHHQRRH